MKKILFTIALLTLGMGANAQVENLDEIALLGKWNVLSRSGEFNPWGVSFGNNKPNFLSFDDGNFTMARFSSEAIIYFKGYWVTKSGTENYFLHMMPWDADQPIAHFRVRKFYRGELELETYDGKNWYNLFNEHGAAVRSVPADTTANAKAYNLGGVELPTPDAAKGIVIQGGKKTVRR